MFSLSDQIPAIFGTSQLAAYGSLEGHHLLGCGIARLDRYVSLLFAAGWTQDIAGFVCRTGGQSPAESRRHRLP